VLFCAPDGTIVDFDLVAANTGERQATLALLEANSIEGTTIICDKGFAGADFEAAVHETHALLLRPSRTDEPQRPNPPIGWIRQRIESIVNTLKDQLLLERHGGRTPAGLLARITARILALCACTNLLLATELSPGNELHAANEDLRRANEQLEQVNRARLDVIQELKAAADERSAVIEQLDAEVKRLQALRQ
jgi:hypothetical protein